MRRHLLPKAEGGKLLIPIQVDNNEIDDVGLLLSKAVGF